MMPVNMTSYPAVRKTAHHAPVLAELEFAMHTLFDRGRGSRVALRVPQAGAWHAKRDRRLALAAKSEPMAAPADRC